MKSLWENLRQGDPESIVSLYEQFYPDLLTYGVRLCNSNETAKDAINDIFLNLWDNRSKLKPVENVKAYLFACLRRNIFKSVTTNRKAFAPEMDGSLQGELVNLSHEDILIGIQQSEEVRRKVQAALGKLTDRQRELILMKYYKGMDYKQIEAQTGMSMKTAYNTVYNGLKILSEELKDIVFLLLIIAMTG